MYRLIVVALSLLCLASADEDDRIVNGEYASIYDNPFVCSIQRYGSHFCGGSIFDKRLIITAAHCLNNYNETHIPQMTVRCGSVLKNSGGVVRDVQEFKIHENFNRLSMMNDVAMILMKTPIHYSNTMRPATLPTALPVEGTSCRVSGWGRLSENGERPTQLQKTNIRILLKDTCAAPPYKYGYRIRNTMICGIGINSDACQGDSGGPLVSNENDSNELVGIVSWGEGCNKPNYPGVYTDVSSIIPWIVDTSIAMNKK